MTRQVSLSEEAYAQLKQAKQGSESFSDVVQRLLRAANIPRKDPMEFVRNPPRLDLPAEEFLAWLKEMREANTRDAWADYEAGRAKRTAK